MALKFRWIAAAAALALAATAPAAVSALDLELTNEYGAGTLVADTDMRFAELVAEKSGGSIDITTHLGGSLGIKGADVIDAVANGVVQIGAFPIASASGIDKRFLISNLPFISGTPDESNMLQASIWDELNVMLGQENQRLLYISSWPTTGFWSKSPLTSIADFKGQRVRTNDPIMTDMLTGVGASPIQLSWADMIPQLQAGSIDMVYTSNAGGVLGKLWEYLPHYVELGVVMGLNVTTINKDVYDGLTDEQRTAIDEAAAEVQGWTRERLATDLKANDEICIQGGTTIVNAPDVPADIRDAFIAQAQPAISQWMEETGDPGKAMLNGYLKEAGKQTY